MLFHNHGIEYYFFTILYNFFRISEFDTQGIRFSEYDLSDPKKTRQSILNLRSFVNEFETSGYGSQSPTVTLNSIARTLNIIEKRLNSLESTIPLGDSS